MNLKDHFPRASKSFLEANLAGITHPTPAEAIRANVAPRRGIMNKTEQAYALILEAMKRKGEILRYEFEGITLRFANVKYTPDFIVFSENLPEPFMKLIEVKGPFIKGNRERAVERFRHAKTYWPEFTFELWQRQKGGEWKHLI